MSHRISYYQNMVNTCEIWNRSIDVFFFDLSDLKNIVMHHWVWNLARLLIMIWPRVRHMMRAVLALKWQGKINVLQLNFSRNNYQWNPKKLNEILPFYLNRIRTEIEGGAWCPEKPIWINSYEYLQIELSKLFLINAIETQGRFGNGQGREFAEFYQIQYQRENQSSEQWFTYSNRKTNKTVRNTISRWFCSSSMKCFVCF